AVAAEAHCCVAIRADPIKRPRALAPFHQLGEIDRQWCSTVEGRYRNRNGHQTLRIGEGQWTQHDATHHRKDRRVGANADRQTQHYDRGKAAVSPERSECVPHRWASVAVMTALAAKGYNTLLNKNANAKLRLSVLGRLFDFFNNHHRHACS